MKVKNTSPKIFNANVALTGNDNDVKINGDYNSGNSSFDLAMAIDKLQMKAVQAFSMKAIENAEGYLNGNLKITGTTKAPNIRGQVKFNGVGLGITQLGSNFKDLNEFLIQKIKNEVGVKREQESKELNISQEENEGQKSEQTHSFRRKR